MCGNCYYFALNKKTVATADDIVQAIWIKRVANVTISRSSVNIQNRILVWDNNSCTYLGKCGSLV